MARPSPVLGFTLLYLLPSASALSAKNSLPTRVVVPRPGQQTVDESSLNDLHVDDLLSMIFAEQRSMQHRNRLRGCATCGSHSSGHRSSMLPLLRGPLSLFYLALDNNLVDCANQGPLERMARKVNAVNYNTSIGA